MLESDKIYQIDVLEGLKKLPDNSINMGITSPPYNKLGLLKGKKQQGGDWVGYITYDGSEDNMPEAEYKQWQIDILNEIQRVLTPNGSFFYNHKNRRYDKSEYSPYEWVKESNLNLYQTIIWDRIRDVNNNKFFFQPTYELIYWLTKDNTKSPKFFKHRLKQQKSIWSFIPNSYLPHPAPFPVELVEQCILATTEIDDIVLDPFIGIGTTAVVAKKLERKYIGFEISENYIKLAEENIKLGRIKKKKEV
jgi:site-specific DNA-methyltransferase (adenine-specific)